MPAIDREAVKTLAIAIGVRPAARQLGLNEDTVCTWAKRYGWFPEPSPRPPSIAVDLKALKASPSQALQNVLQENSHRTKLGFSKAALRVAESVAEASPAKILKDSQAIRHMAHVGSMVGGWDETQNTPRTLSLNILAGAVQVNTGPVPDPAGSE